MSRDPVLFLEDIEKSCAKIVRYTQGLNRDAVFDEGLEQLSEYLDRLGMGEGTLVLFDQRGDAPPITERCSRREQAYGGRRITVLRL